MRFHTALFLRISLLIILLGLATVLWINNLSYNVLFLLFLCIICVVELYFFTRSRSLVYDKTILAILHEDFSADLPEHYQRGTYSKLYQLYETQRKNRFDSVAREQVFTTILDNVDTAILILKQEDESWSVFLMNGYFSKLFGVPKFRNWEHLRAKIPSFASVLEESHFAEMKSAAEIRVDDGELQTFSIQTSRTQTFNDVYVVVLLDSIQKVVERKEKQAWVNLMNVISHELMNSLTPIQSLSQSLNELVKETPDAEDLQDIREGLSTIVKRSNHLQFFVENYRKLTMLPTPVKAPADLNTIIADCIQILSSMFADEKVSVENSVNIRGKVMVDARQFEQVIINLLTNSILAMRDASSKQIELRSWTEPNRLFIAISDTGKGVETEIRDKIFLPFFTTRKDGAGIGLTLSKNIIEAHGGYLNYVPRDGKTEFVICLMTA